MGPLCTLKGLEDDSLLRDRIPMLADAVSRVATRRIRSMATIGGALVNGDPNQDPPPALMALGASVEFRSVNGSRVCPVEDLFVDYYETDVRPGEVLTSVVVPVPPANARGAYLKFLPRTADDYATVSVATMIRLWRKQHLRGHPHSPGVGGHNSSEGPSRRGTVTGTGTD